MARLRVSAIVRRSVLLQLSLSACGLLSCGGETSPSTGASDSGAPASDAGDAATSCAVLSSTPMGTIGGSCLEYAYPLNSTFAQCATDLGTSPSNMCERLCPAPPQDAGNVGTLESCDVFDCANSPIAGCSSPGALGCAYSLCSKGRRTAGVGRFVARGADHAVPRFLARMAYLEAASVLAFERLARELEAHGAPEHLRRGALRAARDEERHTHVATALAQRAGATVPSPRVPKGRPRSLEAIARENAVEGCVHETFGAAVAMAQSMKASDLRVRAAMRRVGPDEMRHAELAWSVAGWLDSRLDSAARARVACARRRAARALVRAAAREVDPDLVAQLGLPAAHQARAIALELTTALWAATSAASASRGGRRWRARGGPSPRA